MDRDSCRDRYEHEPQHPMLRDEYGAVEQRDPYEGYRYDFHMERNRLVYHEIGDVRPQFRMIHQPVIQPSVASQKKEGRKQQQRGRRENRQKDAENSQTQRQQSEYCIKYLHHYKKSLNHIYCCNLG